MELRLAAHWGTYEMRYFLLIMQILVLTSLQGQNLLTIGEVFDFEIGDEFHYAWNDGATPGGDRSEVLWKYVSPNQDTVVYAISHNAYTVVQISIPPYGQINFSKWTDTVSYIYLDSSIAWYDYHFNLDSNIYIGNDSCGTGINAYDIVIGTFEPDYYKATYGRGLGRTRSYSYSTSSGAPGGSLFDWNMTYFKKASRTCGTPNQVSTSEVSSRRIELYPNPVQGKLKVNGISEGNVITLYSLRGDILLETTISSKSIEIDMAKYTPGIYLLELKDKSTTSKSLIIKE